MRSSKLSPAALALLAALLAAPLAGIAGARPAAPFAPKARPHAGAKAGAAKSAWPVGAVALVGDRMVDATDIRRAALVLADDPLRIKQPSLWRKKLLDLCVDRELLGLEAERRGLSSDAAVKHRIERASTGILYAAIRERMLIPEITPSASQIDTARAGGRFRRVRVSYIVSVTDKKATYDLLDAMKHGASFDSIARQISVHPSGGKGGHIGWRRVRDLNARSWPAFHTAKPGDLLGPYPNGLSSSEFYKVEAIVDPDDKDIRDAMMSDRLLELDSRYQVGVLEKYHFQLNPDEVSPVIFASATERADSILASLDPRGRRSKRGVHPSLGIVARMDGDSMTYRDLAYPEVLAPDDEGKAKIESSEQLLTFCSAAVLPRLIERDARERGIDRDPAVARQLRLVREEFSTRAMVARAAPALDSVTVRAYFDSHGTRYQRPAARRAFVAMFASQDTARMARSGWARRAFRDSVFAVDGFRAMQGGTANSAFPRFYGEISLFDTDTDPLSTAVRSLAEGQIPPPIETPNGYALAQALGREPARGFTFEEVRRDVEVDAREDAENTWVVKELERLRAAAPAPRRPREAGCGRGQRTTGSMTDPPRA